MEGLSMWATTAKSRHASNRAVPEGKQAIISRPARTFLEKSLQVALASQQILGHYPHQKVGGTL